MLVNDCRNDLLFCMWKQGKSQIEMYRELGWSRQYWFKWLYQSMINKNYCKALDKLGYDCKLVYREIGSEEEWRDCGSAEEIKLMLREQRRLGKKNKLLDADIYEEY